jgi:hypothetical protein
MSRRFFMAANRRGAKKRSGQHPFAFEYCADLHNVPHRALPLEAGLHGGFAVDRRAEHGYIYYGIAGCGIVRIQPDLTEQEIIDLPSDLRDVNFHSTKIGQFDGKTRLFLPADLDAKVIVLTLEGDVDFILPKPEFEEYQREENAFKPTDTALVENRLYVADGYGANYITSADLSTEKWTGIFGGKTESAQEHGKFGTAHGMNRIPAGDYLAIADRPHSRLEVSTYRGEIVQSHPLPRGSRPCGIDYLDRGTEWIAVVASLDDPDKGRPAPIYILNADYEVVSTIRPKEDLGIELADHIHNAIWYEYNGQLFLICQSWNPGFYFVLVQST